MDKIEKKLTKNTPRKTTKFKLWCGVHNQKGQETGKIKLPSEIFGLELNLDLMHQVAIAQMANSRNVIAHTKDKSEVSGGGAKPWRQKGTGRARHGSNRSPIWRGGGVTFGPTKERNFTKKINKQMKRKALFMALSSKVIDDQMVLLDRIDLPTVKTKQMLSIFNDLKIALGKDFDKSTLLVMPERDDALIRVVRNIPKIDTIGVKSLNIIDILSHKHLLMISDAVGAIKETYLK
ncbi:MAG: 50S ribosomal protein L4 [bacterium]